MTKLDDLFNAVVDMQEETAQTLTKQYLDQGVPATEIFDCYQSAMEEIGKRFEQQIYFIPELIMSGEMMSSAADLIMPHLASQDTEGQSQQKLGKILIATVEGDIHDIGKNIVSMLMDLNGLEVKDIGVDVPADKIVEEAKNFRADVIGLSGLLTLAFDPMKNVVEKLEEHGLRNEVKVIIGGAQMDEQVRKYVGADAFCTDAVNGVHYVKDWIS